MIRHLTEFEDFLEVDHDHTDDPLIKKNMALRQAVVRSNLVEARKLLAEGANPNYLLWIESERKMIEFIDTEESEALEMLRLLVTHGLSGINLLYVFRQIVQSINPDRLEMLGLLLNHGMPLNEEIMVYYDYITQDCTPLQMCLLFGKSDFVPILVERGANITKNDPPLLHMAIKSWRPDGPLAYNVVRYLLDKGANVQEVSRSIDLDYDEQGNTALHEAFTHSRWEEQWADVLTLLMYGADVNALNKIGMTPLMFESIFWSADYMTRTIKLLAKLIFQGKILSEKNINHLHRLEVMGLLEECSNELARTKAIRLSEELTLFDTLHARGRSASFAGLLKQPGVLEKIDAFLATGVVTHYQNDVNQVSKTIFDNKKILETEEDRLQSIFVNFLPKLVIDKIAFFFALDSLKSYHP